MLVACGLVASCNRPPAWVKYPVATSPDRTCRLGVESVTDIYIWECLGGQRVVIAQHGTLFGRQEAEREVAACGGRTKFEEDRLPAGVECRPVPPDPDFTWQTAPPATGAPAPDAPDANAEDSTGG